MARSKTKGRPSFPAHSAGRKKPSPHEVRSEGFCVSEDAPGGNLLSARIGKTNYATV